MKHFSAWYSIRSIVAVFLVTALLLIIIPGTIISAQDSSSITISPPDISQFPGVTFDLHITDGNGSSTPAPTVDQMQVIEDGKAIVPNAINVIDPGLQTILAFNTGSYMAIDYRQQTLFQRMQKQLLDWLALQTSSARDDYNVTSNSGTLLSHILDPQILIQSLSGYKPNLLASIPSPLALSQALEIASEPLPRTTMQRAVLLITVLPDKNSINALPSLADQAVQLGVKVFVWLVAPADIVKSATLPLVQLADKTGGEFFLFSGPETLPNLEDEFQPLRSFLQVQYTSQANTSGSHQIFVRLTEAGNALESPVQTYQISLLPPNPFFLSPQSTIVRAWQKASTSKEQTLLPSTAAFQIKVEFPDGHPRSLVSAKFFVDGILITELTKEPFDTFIWDISPILVSGNHFLQVEIEDTLGLKSKTIELPVELQVEPAPLSGFLRIPGSLNGDPMLVVIVILIVATVLMVILLTRNRILRQGMQSKISRQEYQDPVTQLVQVKMESSLHQPPLVVSHEVTYLPNEKPFARLVRLSEITQDTIPDAIILISKTDVTLGSDPRIAEIGILSESVSPIHARIHLTKEGSFIINDENSTAGTWVNFAPVSPKGARLEDGDLIHIGKRLYRFEVLNLPLPDIPS